MRSAVGMRPAVEPQLVQRSRLRAGASDPAYAQARASHTRLVPPRRPHRPRQPQTVSSLLGDTRSEHSSPLVASNTFAEVVRPRVHVQSNQLPSAIPAPLVVASPSKIHVPRASGSRPTGAAERLARLLRLGEPLWCACRTSSGAGTRPRARPRGRPRQSRAHPTPALQAAAAAGRVFEGYAWDARPGELAAPAALSEPAGLRSFPRLPRRWRH
jgi:hypothetical protein